MAWSKRTKKNKRCLTNNQSKPEKKNTMQTRCTRSLSVYVRMSGIAHGLHALFVFDTNGFSMLNALLLTPFIYILWR